MSRRIVVLGMMGASPFGGQTWLYLNWLASLRSAGHDVWYVEDNRMWQFDPAEGTMTDRCDYAVRHLRDSLARIGMADRWIYRWEATDTCWGATRKELLSLYRSCDALLNICAATELNDDQMLAPFRVWVETDPVHYELKVAAGDVRARDHMSVHQAFATYGERYGQPDCGVPTNGLTFIKTRQPVDLDLWPSCYAPAAPLFTTIGNFRTVNAYDYRLAGYDVSYEGDTYTWSKHIEWERFADLPRMTSQPFQLALSASEEDANFMRSHGWEVISAMPMSLDAFGAYRGYIQRSRGEFTVAKDQNIRLRSGWFSERDACYLASGKPVVTQDTATVLPSGVGLFCVSNAEEAADAIEQINADYTKHCRAARSLAEEHLEGRAVAARLLSDLGLA